MTYAGSGVKKLRLAIDAPGLYPAPVLHPRGSRGSTRNRSRIFGDETLEVSQAFLIDRHWPPTIALSLNL
jgi:hypothetical protein